VENSDLGLKSAERSFPERGALNEAVNKEALLSALTGDQPGVPWHWPALR